MKSNLAKALVLLPLTLAASASYAGGNSGPCGALAHAIGVSNNPHALNGKLRDELVQAVADEKSGLDQNMWATLVNRDGIVCAVAFSGDDRGSQWPGSRVISAQKANTANSFSLDASAEGGVFPQGLALSTANLYSAVQPGGSLFGLQESNPVDTANAYRGPSSNFGKKNDPLVGKKIGGVNVFGGGLALYNSNAEIVGGVGVSGDTSCADHFIGWRLRDNLNLDNLSTIAGVSGDPERPDNIIFGPVGGFNHPSCGIDPPPATLPKVQ